MRKVFLFASALMLSLSFTSCERIDAGCEGILVNLYGSERGVDDVSMVTGRVFYNPATQEVYEYPTYVQTIDYEPFTINAKDGSEFKVDPNVNLKVKDGAAPKVFLLDTLEEAKIIADRERLKIFPLYEENSERIII